MIQKYNDPLSLAVDGLQMVVPQLRKVKGSAGNRICI